jgi:hypothetical protein
LQAVPLPEVIAALRLFLQPVLAALATGEPFRPQWRVGAAWEVA